MTAQTIIIAVISSSAFSAFVAWLLNRLDKRKDKKTGVTMGVQVILYDRIKWLCKQYIKQGYISANDLEDLERMWKVYHNDLDGNGFLDALMNEVEKLPIK